MKKVLFCLAMLSVGIPAFSQIDAGIKAGLNFTELKTDAGSLSGIYKESVGTKTGYSFGAFARFGKKAFIMPEILMATRNAELTFNTSTEKVQFKSIDVPLSLGWQAGKRFRAYAGPVFAFSVAEDQKIKDAFNSYITNVETLQKNMSYGYIAGIGTHILGFDIDIRKEGGLSDVNVVKIDGTDQLTQRQKGFSFTVGLKIL